MNKKEARVSSLIFYNICYVPAAIRKLLKEAILDRFLGTWVIMIHELAQTNFYESWLTKWTTDSFVDFKPGLTIEGKPSLSILFTLKLLRLHKAILCKCNECKVTSHSWLQGWVHIQPITLAY